MLINALGATVGISRGLHLIDSFTSSVSVESAGIPFAVGILESIGFEVFLVSHDGLQMLGVDAVLSKGGKQYLADFKIEKRYTGNLFLELWSNRNPFRPKVGWAVDSMCDYVVYCFLDVRKVFVLHKESMLKFLESNWKRYTEVTQRAYAQVNVTTGVIVPVEDLASCIVFYRETE